MTRHENVLKVHFMTRHENVLQVIATNVADAVTGYASDRTIPQVVATMAADEIIVDVMHDDDTTTRHQLWLDADDQRRVIEMATDLVSTGYRV